MMSAVSGPARNQRPRPVVRLASSVLLVRAAIFVELIGEV
jgi:hypothetical protein